jgi:hypothetical protein
MAMRTIFFFLLLPLFLHSRIVEIQKIEEVLPYLEEKPFVILDIDNTLIKAKQQLGSDQWFYHNLSRYQNEHPPENAFRKALSEYQKVVSVASFLPVEAETKKVVDAIIKSGLPVIALTTRGYCLADATVEQLASIGVNLKDSAPVKKDLSFDNGKVVIFHDGILFTHGTHKGDALYLFLDHLGLKPEKILFVNDKKSHLAQLGETVEKRGFTFTGLRYGFLDEEVSTFKPLIADYQWSHFGHLLTDEEAHFLLELQKTN